MAEGGVNCCLFFAEADGFLAVVLITFPMQSRTPLSKEQISELRGEVESLLEANMGSWEDRVGCCPDWSRDIDCTLPQIQLCTSLAQFSMPNSRAVWVTWPSSPVLSV